MLSTDTILAHAAVQRPFEDGRCPACGTREGVRCGCAGRHAVAILCRDLGDVALRAEIERIGAIDSREARAARAALETERDARRRAVLTPA